MRTLYAGGILDVVVGIYLVAIDLTLVGALLFGAAIVTAIGIYRQHRFAKLS